MNLLLGLELTVLRQLSEILCKIHILRIILLLFGSDGTHLNVTVCNCLLLCKHHYLLVAEKNGLGYSEMDNAEDVSLDNEHRHGSLELLALVDAEVKYSNIKCVDYKI